MAKTTPSVNKPKKDWNKVAKEVDEEKPEGEQALNALFQQIYNDADPDTKRAMMKSFTESNGTCLSTNWAEIGNKKTEVKPPEGMIAKKVSNYNHSILYILIAKIPFVVILSMMSKALFSFTSLFFIYRILFFHVGQKIPKCQLVMGEKGNFDPFSPRM